MFIISGGAQVFWTIPMFLGWSIRWYYAGIIGTAGLAILLAASRIPNPYRQTEGVVREQASNTLPPIPDYYTNINRRINRLDIKIDDDANKSS